VQLTTCTSDVCVSHLYLKKRSGSGSGIFELIKTFCFCNLRRTALKAELSCDYYPDYWYSWSTACIIWIRFISFSRRLMGFGSDGLLLMLGLTLWFPTKRFATLVKNNKDPIEFKRILKAYEDLKVLSVLINNAGSLLIFAYLMEGILFFSLVLKTIMTLSSSGVFVAFFFISFLAFIFVASDSYKKVFRTFCNLFQLTTLYETKDI